MRLRHIEIFYTIYTSGSVTNAAKILHITQPSVSKSLANAEMLLGFPLFKRVRGRLVPTGEAEILIGEVDKLYQQLRCIRNTAENIKKIDYGQINLAFTPALGFNIAPRTLATFKKQHPNVNVNIQAIHNLDVFQALLERQCDLAITFAPNKMPGVASVSFGKGEFVIMYPKAFFPDIPSKLPLKALTDFDLIGIGESGKLDNLVINRFLEEKVKIKSSIQVQTLFMAARIAAENIAICVVDEFTARGNLTDNVAIASFDPPLTFPITGLYLEKHQLTKYGDDFVQHLKQGR